MTVIKKSPGAEPDQPLGSERPIWRSLKRGWKQTCPACGTGALYYRYLKVNDACPSCGEELHHHRADDAPPYFTIIIVGHFIVWGILISEQTLAPPIWLQLSIWLPLTAVLSLLLLPRVKGALIGYQWANRMHGFGPEAFEGADLPPSEPAAANAP